MKERTIQSEIMLALGAEPDLVLFKNSVGRATFVDRHGREHTVPYGLAVGSPDLVGILAPAGRWFCLEVKRPGERATPEQATVHAIWRRFGAYVAVVHSVDAARSALAAARLERLP